MEEIVEFLAGIGMSRFAETFVAHGIDLGIAPELTDGDLKELGVDRLGDRKVLLREIGRLRPRDGGPQAHRRLLSVLFCDLVGSTALARRIDAEDLRSVLLTYHQAARESIRHFGGFIGTLMGDGVMAYFGWPQAQEDQAAQAVRAGLELVATMRTLRFEYGVVVHCRVGIATGRVVMGDASDPNLAFGETLNLAARLQAHAHADRVVTDAATNRWIGRRFKTVPLPAADLKGFAHPVSAWNVLEEHPSVDRFETRAAGRAQFAGREAEMGTLTRLWETVLSGRGQAVTVTGGAGFGKSRLVREFQANVARDRPSIVRFQCSAHHSNSVFYPVIQSLEDAAGIDPAGDSAAAKRGKLEELVARRQTPEPEDLLSLAQMLDLSIDEETAGGDSSAAERRRHAIRFLVRRVLIMSRERPVLAIVEDVHWIDPSSSELLAELVAAAVAAKVMVIATTRTDNPSLPPGHRATEIRLEGVADAETETIVRSIDGADGLSEREVRLIVSRVDGIPLFAEELTSAAIEHGRVTRSDELPETVEASLTARLDFLRHGKAVAQVGSVLGREFAGSQLEALAQPVMAATALRSGLRELTAAGLVEGPYEDVRYRFSHALVQEVAYASLLRRTRQQLHERAARNVISEPGRAREPELVAHHLTEAGLVAESLEYWKAAGGRSAEKSANAEAISHFRRGLELIAQLAEEPSRDALELSFLVACSGPLIAEFGYTSTQLTNCIARALTLSERIGHTPEMYPLLYARWAVLLTSGSMPESLRVAQDYSRLAERQQHPDALFARHRMLGASYMCLGDLARAEDEFDAIIAGYDPERHGPLAHSHGLDLLVAGQCFSSEVLWLMGRADEAARRAQSGLTKARATGHVNSIAMALHFCGLVSFLNRDPAAVREHAAEMTQLTDRQPAGAWPSLTGAMLGWSLIAEGDVDQGLPMLIDGVERARSVGVSMFVPMFHCRIAEVLIGCGAPAKAAQRLAVAEELIARTGEVNYRSELLRLQAVLAAERGAEREADELLHQAIELARRQGARSLEFRATATWRTINPA
jgi:class 3 adenylate cyclase/tetratricopeptide (TPR) repeat protein/ABC-type transport system involved in cytochrome c biogenesis ATPase subunit